MISDWELWACAQQVIRQRGDEAAAHAAERIALEAAGDNAGVATWKAIATRIDLLNHSGGARPKSKH